MNVPPPPATQAPPTAVKRVLAAWREIVREAGLDESRAPTASGIQETARDRGGA